MDSLAVIYAGELSRWGIETSIIVPGAFTEGHEPLRARGLAGGCDARGRVRERTRPATFRTSR